MSIASAVGIDLGSRNIVLSTIRGGTIECLTNDLSNRLTPTYVSFGNNQRFIGESGFTKVNANFRNTIPYSPRLLGLQANSE